MKEYATGGILKTSVHIEGCGCDLALSPVRISAGLKLAFDRDPARMEAALGRLMGEGLMERLTQEATKNTRERPVGLMDTGRLR